MGNAAEEPGPGQLTPDILIAGAGAMGVLFAARLSTAGLQVGVLDEWAEGIRALQTHGACLESADGARECYPIRASHRPEDFAGARYAIVLVKAWQTAQAAQQLAACLHPNGSVLTLQNGLGNRESLAGVLGVERVIAGVTTMGASLHAPGQALEGGEGEIALEAGSRGEEFRALLRRAGLNVRTETDLPALLWDKLVVNAAVNPVSALLELRNGEILANADALETILAAAREAAGVAQALEIVLPYQDPKDRVIGVLRKTAANRTSMLQDMLRGAPTEIEAISGAVVNAGESAGMKMPVNRTLYHLVKAKAETRLRSPD